MTQEEFEQLIGRQPIPDDVVLPKVTVVYFTASWCGACRRLNLPALEQAFPDVNWLKCDIDANNYSPGYCGVRGIPAFMVFAGGKPQGPFKSSSTEKVVAWLETLMEDIVAK